MRKQLTTYLLLMLSAALMTGCSAGAEQRTGEAEGYGGPLRVTVSLNGSDITSVTVVSHQETPGVGTRAIEALPDLIARQDSVDVDGVTGATITSQAIRAAVAQAIGQPMTSGEPENTASPMTTSPASAMSGVGLAATGRPSAWNDEDGNPVYSFNVVFAAADFDQQGRILDLDVEQLEVQSSQFSGFPADAAGEEAFLSQVSQWTGKGAKGDGYMLGSGSWRQQMDVYERMMTGKTLDEVMTWFEQNFSTETGKPVDNGTADAVSGATISLRDEHGDILTAVERAWEDAKRRQGSAGGEGMANPAQGASPADAASPTDAAAPTESASPMEDGVMNDSNETPDVTGEEETFG